MKYPRKMISQTWKKTLLITPPHAISIPTVLHYCSCQQQQYYKGMNGGVGLGNSETVNISISGINQRYQEPKG